MGSHSHCTRQGERRKAVLSSAAAWFSFVTSITFNIFQCFVRNKSPWRGSHGLPGIRTCCSRVSSICHCIYIGMHFGCSGLFVLPDDSVITKFLSFTFQVHRGEITVPWHRALAQPLMLVLLILFALIAYIYLRNGGKAQRRCEMPGSTRKISGGTKGIKADWLLHYIEKCV